MRKRFAPVHHVLAEALRNAMQLGSRVVGIIGAPSAFLCVFQVPPTTHLGATLAVARGAQREVLYIRCDCGVLSITKSV
jgi:hypothetical protein